MVETCEWVLFVMVTGDLTVVISFPPQDKRKESFLIFSSIISWDFDECFKEIISQNHKSYLRFVFSVSRKYFPMYKNFRQRTT